MTLKDDINSALYSDQQSEKYYERTTGTGCVFRYQLDTGYFQPSLSKYNCVVGSFLHQDLIAPKPAYNLAPSDSNLTKSELEALVNLGVPSVGTLAHSPSKVKFLFSGDQTFDIQDPNLNSFVLYAHDSNSCDKRAVCIKDKKDGNIAGWQGPCLWDQGGGNITFTDDVGAGAWPMGNPHDDTPLTTGKGKGGGTGYHCENAYQEAKKYKTNYKTAVSQIDMPGQENYVDEYEYFKYYEYNEKWYYRANLNDWWPVLQAWYNAATKEPNLQTYNPHQKLDTFGWVDRMAAMISLQNGFYWNRDKLGFRIDKIETSYEWWGWNEIPFDISRAIDPGCWDCLAVVMPLNVDHWDYPYTNLDPLQKKYIKDIVDEHYSLKFRYGSNIAILQQQWIDKGSDGKTYWCIKLVCQDVIPYANLLN